MLTTISLWISSIGLILFIISILVKLFSIIKLKKEIKSDPYKHLKKHFKEEIRNSKLMNYNIKISSHLHKEIYENIIIKNYKSSGERLEKADLKTRIKRYTFLFLNSGLISAAIIKSLQPKRESKINEETIVGMLIDEKIKKETKSYVFIFLAMLIALIYPLILSVDTNYWIIGFFLIAFSMLTLNHKILEYRIARGFYGNNQYEVREIISYIQDKSSDDDFHNGKKVPIFQSPIEVENQDYTDAIDGVRS